MDAVGREESVVDSLAKAVRVDRIAEIVVRVRVVLAQRSRSHAELERWREVVENFAPIALFPRASSMALVHDDEIEEIRTKFLIEARAVPHLWRLPGRSRNTSRGFFWRRRSRSSSVRRRTGRRSCPWDRRSECCGRRGTGFGAGDVRPSGSSVHDHSFQQIWKATAVLPVPVAIVRSVRLLPVRIDWIVRLMAIS